MVYIGVILGIMEKKMMEITITNYMRIIGYIYSGFLRFVSWYSMVETIIRALVPPRRLP